jgi:hypothetical protein
MVAPSLAVVDLSQSTPSILAALHKGCVDGCFYGELLPLNCKKTHGNPISPLLQLKSSQPD